MKTFLMSSAAVMAFLFAVGQTPANAAVPGVDLMVANQDQSASVADSSVAAGQTASHDDHHFGPPAPPAPAAASQTGDVNYGNATFGGYGIYTLQNNTGYNDAANNGAQVAAQINTGGAGLALADQDQSASVKKSGTLGTTRTGDVNYNSGAFSSGKIGVYTLQNTTGSSDAANNGMQLAAQLNDGTAAGIVATQSQDATVSHSGAAQGTRTGDVSYGNGSISSNGIFTLQNTTGVDNAANNATQITAQVNDDSVHLAGAVSSQDMNATVANVGTTVNASPVYGSRTGNINYGATFSGVGVYTISNTTGANNAANNATSIAVQLNNM